MAALQIKEIEYPGYGRALEISNGLCRLAATLDKGPRIISFRLEGQPNVMFEDLKDGTSQSGPEFDRFYYPGAAWHIYGGHRLWISPESLPECYYPDNNPVEYTVENGAVTFVPSAQAENGLQFTLRVEMEPDSARVKITHRIRNISNAEKIFAPWCLTVLAPGGTEIVPQPDRDTGLLGNRVLALWPYTNMADHRVFWGNRYITLAQDRECSQKFKFGLNGEKGWAAYLLGSELFIKRFRSQVNGSYPDGGCSFETFTCADFLEMESLGELLPTAPGEERCHTEEWELCEAKGCFDPKNESKIDRFVAENRLRRTTAVAIDGPAGAGKSTIARAAAQKLGFLYVDTGAMYRTIGLAVRRAGKDTHDAAEVESCLPAIHLSLGYENGVQQVFLNGDNVSKAIRTPEASMDASAVSAIPAVRAFLLEQQRELARQNDVIMDGRDIGTVVLPDAAVKIFLTAAPEERAGRRHKELLEKGETVSFEEVLADVKQRDYQDSHRAAAPLKQAEDAVLADTTGFSLAESIRLIEQIIRDGMEGTK